MTIELIDFHTHVRPPWWEGLTNPEAGFGSDGGETVARLVDVPRLIEESRRAGVSRRALSVGVEGVYGPHGTVAPADVRRINEFTAEAVAKDSELFLGLATVDLFAGEAGAAEAVYAVRELGLHGLFLDSQRAGKHPGSPEARPTLAAAAELGVPIFIHPVWAPDDDHYFTAAGQAGRSFGRGLTNGLAALALLHADVFTEFPDLDVVVTALGTGAVLFAADALVRYEREHGVRPRLHVDTLRFHPPTIGYLVDALGADRVVFGSDWPIRLDAYAEQVVGAFERAGLSAEQQALVGAGNARRLFALGEPR